MFDTLAFHIPVRGNQKLIEAVSALSSTTYTVENASGIVSSQITSAKLFGSFDSRISVQLCSHEFQSLDVQTTIPYFCAGQEFKALSKKLVLKVSCDPFIRIEFSLPKFHLGVNFFNLTLNQDIKALLLFRSFFESLLGCSLPTFHHWKLVRADVSYCIDLGSEKAVLSFIESHRNTHFPRRGKPVLYPTSLYWPSRLQSFKIYGKYSEFKVHDYKRFRAKCDSSFADFIHNFTYGIIRIETSIRKQQLTRLNILTCMDLLSFDWCDYMNTQIFKVLDGAKGQVLKQSDVLCILKSYPIKGISWQAAFAIWTLISLQGRKSAELQFGYKMTYRARAAFKALGISTASFLREDSNSVRALAKTDLRLLKFGNDREPLKRYLEATQSYRVASNY